MNGDADEVRIVEDGDTYCIIDGSGTVRPVYRVPDEAHPPSVPGWAADLRNHDWDSCVAFIRHAERPSHFLKDRFEIGGTDLTAGGRVAARLLGRELRDFDLELMSSPVSRCVSTCRSVAEGYGKDLPIEEREEIGGSGTAFMFTYRYTEEECREPGTTAVLGHMGGRPINGWYPLSRCVRSVMGMLEPHLARKGVLTLCVNHDLFVSQIEGGMTGRFPSDGWVSYLDGLMICRKGTRTFAVVDGKEYDYAEPFDTADLSPSRPPRELELCPMADPPRIRNFDPGVLWAGEPHEGIRRFIDARGYFRHVCEDGFLVYGRVFDWAGDFSGGVAPVALEGVGATFVTDFGDYLHNRWFREVRGYSEGIAAVRDSDGWFHIGMDGEPLYLERYDSVSDVHDGICFCTSGAGAVIREFDLGGTE